MIQTNNKLHLKNQIINHLMLNGNKKTCANNFLKSSKAIQKFSTKNYKNLIILAVKNSSPIIKIKKIKKKRKKNIKEFPFLLNKKNRITLAIKYILTTSKKKLKNLYKEIKYEIIESSKKNSNTIVKKNKLQEYALLKKKYIHYRWF